MSLIAGLSHALRRWSLRRRQYSGGAKVIDALYDRADPWNLSSIGEQKRFAATSTLISAICPQVGTLLEIGCGEGHQTAYFLGLADHVTAIDISANALARAKVAAPGATYLEGEIDCLLPDLPVARYDVATLCEILYYVADPAAMIACVQGCADHLFVTIYEPQARRLAPLFDASGWREMPPVVVDRKSWKIYHWTR